MQPLEVTSARFLSHHCYSDLRVGPTRIYLSQLELVSRPHGVPEAAQLPPSVERIPLDVVVVFMSLAELFSKCFRGKNFNKIPSVMKINF